MSMGSPVGDLVSMLKTPDDTILMIERLRHSRERVLTLFAVLVVIGGFASLGAAYVYAGWWHIPLIVLGVGVVAVSVYSELVTRRLRQIYAIRKQLLSKS